MKKIFSFILTIILLWALFVFFEYSRAYRSDEKLMLTLNTEVTREYTKRTGLGFSIIEYDLKEEDYKTGTITKEFYVLGIRFSKETIL